MNDGAEARHLLHPVISGGPGLALRLLLVCIRTAVVGDAGREVASLRNKSKYLQFLLKCSSNLPETVSFLYLRR